MYTALSGAKNKNVEILENDGGLSFTCVRKRTEGFLCVFAQDHCYK